MAAWLLADIFWVLVQLAGRVSTDCIRQDLGMSCAKRCPSCWSVFVLVALHQMLNEMNKTNRLFFSPLFFPPPTTSCRWPATMGRSTLALCPWPVDESQLRSETPAHWNGSVVLREQFINRMESEWVALVDSWETYVIQTPNERLAVITCWS